MPLSEDVKTDVMRLLKYEIQGLYQLSPGGGSTAYGPAGFRYFTAYGNLLFRLNWMRPIEEAKLTGQATGWISFSGLEPLPGDSITVTLASGALIGGSIVVTVTVPPVLPVGASPWTLLTVAQAFASAFGGNAVFLANGFEALADYGQNPGSQQRVAVPICSINAPVGFANFTLTVTSTTGRTVPYVTPTAVPVAPYISYLRVGVPNTTFGYIPILNALDAAYGGETITLSVSEANGAKFRNNVLDQRERQIEYYRKQLSDYVGIAINRTENACGNTVSF